MDDILDNLDDLKISSIDEETLRKVAMEGLESPDFTSLVAELANELALLYDLGSRVSVNKDLDTDVFLRELCGLLAELNCPYPSLNGPDVVLQGKDECLTLLLYLTSELQAARMRFFHQPVLVAAQKEAGSEVFHQLKTVCLALRMAKPPDGITAQAFINGIEKKIQDAKSQCANERLLHPAVKQTLGPVHWEKLELVNEALRNEYEMRRSMLLRRLDVTISSFNWSERAKFNVDGVAEAYGGKRRLLKRESDVSFAHLLAARNDLAIIAKTASGTTRQFCQVNKVMMGHVPDRGGRTNEINAPLPEMPSWQKRREGGGGGGRGDHRPSSGGRGFQGRGFQGRGGQGRGGRGNNRRGRDNWGRGRGRAYQSDGHFEQAFSHGGFNSGRQ